jgi:hypothetical protein
LIYTYLFPLSPFPFKGILNWEEMPCITKVLLRELKTSAAFAPFVPTLDTPLWPSKNSFEKSLSIYNVYIV